MVKFIYAKNVKFFSNIEMLNEWLIEHRNRLYSIEFRDPEVVDERSAEIDIEHRHNIYVVYEIEELDDA